MTITVDELFETLHTSDPVDKRDALEALFDYPCDDRVLEAAAYLLTDPDRGVREAASRLLVLWANDKAASLAAVHITSLNIAVRNLAGDTLVKMSDSAVRALYPYIDSADKDIRKFAIDLLAQLPSDSAVIERIAAHLADPDPNVLTACIDAIGASRAHKYLNKLLLLYDHHEYLRPNIIYAFSKFERKPSLQFLLAALSDDNPVVQLAAAEVLASRKDLDTLKVLLLKLSSVSDLAKPVILHSLVVLLESENYEGEMPKALKHDLMTMLDDVDTSYVRAAVRGLRYFTDGETLLKLVLHTGREDSIDNAIVSILKDYPQEVLPIILEDAAGDARVAALGKTAVLLLRKWEETEFQLKPEMMQRYILFISRCFPLLDIDTKITVVTISERLAPPWAVQLVRTALSDRDPAVRNYAIDVTPKIGEQYFSEDLRRLTSDVDEEIRLAADAILSPQKFGYQN